MPFAASPLLLLLPYVEQEVKSLKSTVAKMDALARERDALLAEKTELVDRLQVNPGALSNSTEPLQVCKPSSEIKNCSWP